MRSGGGGLPRPSATAARDAAPMPSISVRFSIDVASSAATSATTAPAASHITDWIAFASIVPTGAATAIVHPVSAECVNAS